MRLHVGSASAERVGQGQVGGVTQQGVVHMVAASLGFEMAMVGTGWGISHFDYMDRLRKYYLDLVEGWFLVRKDAYTLSRCMTIDSVDYCVLVNEWAWSKPQVCLLQLELNMGSVLESENG